MARRRGKRGGGSSGGDSGRARTGAARAAVGVDLDDEAFQRGLRDAVKRMELKSEADLQRLAIRVQNEARKLAPVDTGRLRSSIQHTMGRDSRGPYAEVGTNVHYARHVEFGTVHSPAQPYLRPAFLLAARWWAELSRGGRA